MILQADSTRDGGARRRNCVFPERQESGRSRVGQVGQYKSLFRPEDLQYSLVSSEPYLLGYDEILNRDFAFVDLTPLSLTVSFDFRDVLTREQDF